MRRAIKTTPEKSRRAAMYGNSQPINRWVWDRAMDSTQESTVARRAQKTNQHQPTLTTETPDMESLQRADAPAIWTGYRGEFDALKVTIDSVLAADPDNETTAKIAKITRLDLRKVRIAVEHRRKELGDFHLRQTQGINSEAKILKDLILPYEDKLAACENHAQIEAQKRTDALTETRHVAMAAVDGPASNVPLGLLTDEQFAAMLAGATAAHAEAKAASEKETADRLAKKKADEAKFKKAQAENKKLRAEVAEKETALAAERAEAKAAANLEREAKEEAEAKLAQAAQERKAEEQAAQDAADEAELAPDREKMKAFAARIRAIEQPTITNERKRQVIAMEVERLAIWVEAAAKKPRK